MPPSIHSLSSACRDRELERRTEMARDDLEAAAAAAIVAAADAAAAIVAAPDVAPAAAIVAAPDVAGAAAVITGPDVAAHAAVVTAPEVFAAAAVVTRPDVAAPAAVVTAPEVSAASADDDEGALEALELLAEVVEKTMAMTVNEPAAASVKNKEPASTKVPVPASLVVAQPSTRKTKKLLVLNISGLLADINRDSHNARLSNGRFRGNLVFKRPFCDDFLKFCFCNFEVGVWSSRMSHNIDAAVDIVMKDFKRRLLFCWDASKCTATGFYTLENENKALVLKELKKLWSKGEGLPWHQGQFSPSNTLLLDDTPYKALRNPLHTAIFPYPYSYKNRKDDSSLGPGGDIRLYLEGVAAADDVPCFVREHPFGQPAITETHPNWNFYKRVLLDE